MRQAAPSADLLTNVRSALRRQLETHSYGIAVGLVHGLLPFISRIAPEAALEFVVVRERDLPLFDRDLPSALAAYGLDVPDDLDERCCQVVDVTLTQALATVASALDRFMAEAESSSGGDG
jgi:hypothetical protein